MSSPRIWQSPHRAGVAVVALCVPLALMTGCGAGGSTPGGTASASHPPSALSSASTATASTAAELGELSLTVNDLKGFAVRELEAAEVLTPEDLRPGEEECAPLSRVMAAVALGGAAATAQRRVTSELDEAAIDEADSETEMDAALTVLSTTVTLASYPGEKQAKAAFVSLRDAIGTCEGGFSSLAVGPEDKGRVRADTAPDTGDEAVAFTATVSGDGGLLGPTKAVVFRQGSTLAQFATVNTNALGSAEAGDWNFPAALVEAQAAKLG